ncbi:MAG: MarR family transcriptional regulator [Chloroflexi bacterium]|nr:MarR family transcriptional regulator [Chloroflexota bacterium]
MRRSVSSLQNALLYRAWIQWIALGVDAVGKPDDAVVDPEALIALTAELGDADARLRDVSTDWCVLYGRYVNGARLKQVARELRTPPEAIGEYVATVAAAGGPAWPMATQPRPEYRSRGKARLDSARPPSRLRIRLRAAFGVNARADILAALLAAPQNGLSVADLARKTRFTKPSTAFAADALVLAGLLERRPGGNRRLLVLTTPGEILPGIRPPIIQPDWVARFGVALEVLRFDRQDEMSPSVRAIEARRVVEGLLDRITREALPMPDLHSFGDEFSGAFDRWIVHLVDSVRAPAPT